jgi:hypothetical protein
LLLSFFGWYSSQVFSFSKHAAQVSDGRLIRTKRYLCAELPFSARIGGNWSLDWSRKSAGPVCRGY